MQEPRRLQSPRKGSAIYGFLISISPSSLNQFSGKGKHTPCMVRADCVDGLGTMEKTQREDSSPMSSGHRSPQGQKPGSRVTCRRTQQHRLRAEHPRARCWGPHRKPSAVHSPERGSSGCLCSEPVSLHKHVLAGVCVWGEGWREGGRGATWGGASPNPGGTGHAKARVSTNSLQQVFSSLGHPVQGHSRVAPQPPKV